MTPNSSPSRARWSLFAHRESKRQWRQDYASYATYKRERLWLKRSPFRTLADEDARDECDWELS